VADHIARQRLTLMFAVQLALNAIWSPALFGLEAPNLGLAIIISLLVTLAATLIAFWNADGTSGFLLVRYLV
jgi:benzodiazapine receptor